MMFFRAFLLGLCCLLAFAAISHGQSPPGVDGQNLLGTWSALTPQATTTIHLELRGPVTKDADGSLNFAGDIWSSGGAATGKANLEVAKLVNNKLSLKYSSGIAELAVIDTKLEGFITYYNRPLQGLQFKK